MLRHEMLLRHAGVGIGYYSLDGVILMLNQHAVEQLGGPSESFVGRTATGVFGPALGATILDRIRETASAGRPLEFEDEAELPTGRRWFVSTYAAIPDAAGHTVGVQIVSLEVTARKRAEVALRQSETRYRDLVENLNDVIYTLAPDGTILYASPAITPVLGYRPDEIVGVRFERLVHPDDRERIMTAFQGTLAGRIEPSEYQLVTREGSRVWARTSSRPVLENGEVREVHGVLTDVTVARRAHRDLELSRELLVQAQRLGRIGCWKWESRTGRLTWSEELYRIWGIDPGLELRLETIEALIHPDDRPLNRRQVEAMLGRGGGFEHELRIIRPDGEVRHLRHIAEATCDGGGRVLRVVGVMQDVSERRQAAAALAESEERYRRLFSEMAEGVALHEIIREPSGRPVDYRFLDANPAFFELTGLGSDILGRTVLEILPDLDPSWIEVYAKVAQTGVPARFESSALGRLWEVRAFSPQPGRFAALFLDITEWSTTEAERERLLERVRGLTARLAEDEEHRRLLLARELHDRIGQNLTAVALNLSIVRAGLPEAAAGAIVDRLGDTIALLESTAADLRTIMVELRPPVLDELGLLAALRWLAEQMAARYGLKVDVAGHEPDRRLADPVEIAVFRIVQEALTNIHKHAGTSAASVRVTSGPAELEVVVEDSGAGFDVAVALGAGAPTRWGLIGMSERAEGIGGRLELTSTPGAGTRVRLVVPR